MPFASTLSNPLREDKATAPLRKLFHRAVPKRLFVPRSVKSVKTLVPFVRTLNRAFADLDRLSRGWPSSATVETRPKPTPPTQHELDSRIHAGKQRIATLAQIVSRSSKADEKVVIGDFSIPRAKVIRDLRSAEKRNKIAKDLRGKLQKSPPQASPPKEEPIPKNGRGEGTGTKHRSPSYLRRQNLRSLNREIAELKAVVPVPQVVVDDSELVSLRKELDELRAAYRQLEQKPAEVVTVEQPAMVNFAQVPFLNKEEYRMNFTLPQFTKCVLKSKAGVATFSRAKLTSKKTAFDFCVPGGKNERIGILSEREGALFLKLSARDLAPAVSLLLCACYTFEESPFPGDWDVDFA